MTEASHCRPMPNCLGNLLTHVVYSTNLTTIQSSKRFVKNGRRRRRRRRPRARPTRSVTGPTFSSVSMMVPLLVRLLSTGRCDKQLVCLVNPLNTLNFLPSGTNLRPLAIQLHLSTARRVQVFLRAWLSMPPQTAMHTTVQIVTAAVTPNRRTDRTRRCIRKAISQVLMISSRGLSLRNRMPRRTPSNNKCTKSSILRYLFSRESANFDDFPYGSFFAFMLQEHGSVSASFLNWGHAFSPGGGCMF